MRRRSIDTTWQLALQTKSTLQARQAARYFSQCRSRAQSIAPKRSFDSKYIRQNPDVYARNCLGRNYKAQSSHPFKIVQLFDEWHHSQIKARTSREKGNAIQNQLSNSITSSGIETLGQDDLKKHKDSLIEQARELKDRLSSIEKHEAELLSEIDRLASELPNLTSPETPREEPRVISYINQDLKPLATPAISDSTIARDHFRIGHELDLLDFSAAATTSGWGWYYLKNEAAMLEQALIQYANSVAMSHGFTMVVPPSMVYAHIASACGFQPRDQSDEQQIYDVQQSEKDQEKGKPGHSLAATAEIPFAGMKANAVIQRDELPIRVVGPSRCYRAEAGARGADTKGLYRVHEFTKVEMFAWTAPGEETAMFETMLKIQTEILTGLGLHCRILEMPSTDLGASAFRKRDIEAYFPSRQNQDEGWGEVTSTSICTDYQTRRLNTRIKAKSGVRMDFASTVNGTAVAVPRVLAALLEYGLESADSRISVKIPAVLWPYMHGLKAIEKEKPGRVN